MVIAVNTRFLLTGYREGYGNFIYECFIRIPVLHPQHSFIFIFDRPFESALDFPANVTKVILPPPARHPILWWVWYNIKLPAILKKYKADVFVSPDGFCSLYTGVPQCLVIHDLAFLHYPKFISRSHYLFYKKFTPLFIKKATRIVTVSQFSAGELIKYYPAAENKMDVVFNGVGKNFLPLDFGSKQTVKDTWAAGNEYFLCTGSIHPRKNLINLLKAFSIFKKKQKSTMKLLIVGRMGWQYDSFTTLLKSYKYRSDVILTGYVDQPDLIKITASAYAMVYPSLYEGFGVPPLEAMKSGVAVLASNTSAIPEIGGDAVLYFDPTNPTDIASQMITIYKDENCRNEYIQRGFERVTQFSWDITARLLWQSISSMHPTFAHQKNINIP